MGTWLEDLFDEPPAETDVEEQMRLNAEKAARDASDAAARRAQIERENLAAGARKARLSAQEQASKDKDTMVDDAEDKKKKKKSGISSLRIDQSSSLGGTPMTTPGLTV